MEIKIDFKFNHKVITVKNGSTVGELRNYFEKFKAPEESISIFGERYSFVENSDVLDPKIEYIISTHNRERFNQVETIYPDLYIYDIFPIYISELDKDYNSNRGRDPSRTMKLMMTKIIGKITEIKMVIVKLPRPMMIDYAPSISKMIFLKIWLDGKIPHQALSIYQHHKYVEYDITRGIMSFKPRPEYPISYDGYELYQPDDCSICTERKSNMYLDCGCETLSCCELCVKELNRCPICSKTFFSARKTVSSEEIFPGDEFQKYR